MHLVIIIIHNKALRRETVLLRYISPKALPVAHVTYTCFITKPPWNTQEILTTVKPFGKFFFLFYFMNAQNNDHGYSVEPTTYYLCFGEKIRPLRKLVHAINRYFFSFNTRKILCRNLLIFFLFLLKTYIVGTR